MKHRGTVFCTRNWLLTNFISGTVHRKGLIIVWFIYHINFRLTSISGDLQFSIDIFGCDTIFSWTGALTNITEVLVKQDNQKEKWSTINNSRIRVNNTFLYDSIEIRVRVYEKELKHKPYKDFPLTYEGTVRAVS